MTSTSLDLSATAQGGRAASAGSSEIRAETVNWRDMAGHVAVAEWDALAMWAASPNPFFESWYLLPALEAFDQEGDVRVLRFETNGVLAGILPLVEQSRYYRHPLPQLSSWVHGNCFLGAPLVARGLEKPFWRALFEWADRNAKSSLFLHLGRFPLDGPLYEALTAVLAEEKRPAALVHHEERAMLCSNLSPEAYLEAALSGKKRKELRRQHNRLSELGDLAFERCLSSESIEEWIEDFLKLEVSGWKGQRGNALANDPGTSLLFRNALTGAAERGRLERLTLSLNGSPIAMLANFLTPPGAFSFKTAFDENYARFSPGVLLQRENLALLNHADIQWCDSCASADHPMIDHLWRERRKIGRINIGIGGGLRQTIFRLIARFETGSSKRGLV